MSTDCTAGSSASTRSSEAAPLATIDRVCPICGFDNSSSAPGRYSRDAWRLKTCARCGLVYLENAPSYVQLESEFAWEKTYAQEKARRRRGRTVRYAVSDAGKRLKRLIRGGGLRAKENRFIRRHIGGGRMLDVGCGSGRTLMAIPDGVIPYGIEISRFLARKSDELCAPLGGHVVQRNAIDGMDAFEPEFFDGMMMRAFLEHETQPRELLERAHRPLKRDGRIIIKVPNFGCLNRMVTGDCWCGLRFPDHVNYFTPRTLRRLVEESGYRVIQFGPLDHFAFSDNMWMVIGKAQQQSSKPQNA